MKITRAKKLEQRLANRDEEIIHDLQWLADNSLTYAPREHWWHWLVPRTWRLMPVVELAKRNHEQRQG